MSQSVIISVCPWTQLLVTCVWNHLFCTGRPSPAVLSSVASLTLMGFLNKIGVSGKNARSRNSSIDACWKLELIAPTVLRNARWVRKGRLIDDDAYSRYVRLNVHGSMFWCWDVRRRQTFEIKDTPSTSGSSTALPICILTVGDYDLILQPMIHTKLSTIKSLV